MPELVAFDDIFDDDNDGLLFSTPDDSLHVSIAAAAKSTTIGLWTQSQIYDYVPLNPSTSLTWIE